MSGTTDSNRKTARTGAGVALRTWNLLQKMRCGRPASRAWLGVALITMTSLLLPQVATAAPSAPAVASPRTGEHVAASLVPVTGTVDGSTVLVRVQEGATVLADTGVSSGGFEVLVPLPDGPHTLAVRARDSGGTFGPAASVSFVVDTAPPAPPVIGAPADGSVVGATPVRIDGTGEPGATLRVTDESTSAIYQTAVDVLGNWAVDAPLSNGAHRLNARAVDTAGNVSSQTPTVSVTVDTVAPLAPTIALPSAGAWTNKTMIQIAGFAEPGGTLRLEEGSLLAQLTVLGDGSWQTTQTFTAGPHTLTARVWDAAGHPSPATTRSFTIDLTPPMEPVIVTPAEGALLSPSETTIAGTGEPGADVFVLRGEIVIGIATVGANTNWFMRVTSPAGPNELRARQRDRAGNFGPYSPMRRFTVDDQPPVVTITSADNQIFFPGQLPEIKGFATDNLGVDDIRLDFYDLAGRGVMSSQAICDLCPSGTLVQWRSSQTPLAGRFVVKVYANDRVGNRSLEKSIVITVVRTP